MELWHNGNIFNEKGYCPDGNGIPMIHTLQSQLLNGTF